LQDALLNKFQPVTLPVQVIHIPGDSSTPASTTVDPNPVIAELQPAGPLPEAAPKVVKRRKPKPPKPAPASPFPDPSHTSVPVAPSR
jgi:hypothetical protein